MQWLIATLVYTGAFPELIQSFELLLGYATIHFSNVQDARQQASAPQLPTNQPHSFIPTVNEYHSTSQQTMAEINPGMQPTVFGQQATQDGAADSGMNLMRETSGTQSPGSHSPRRANTKSRPAPDVHDGFTKDGPRSYRCNQCGRVVNRITNMRAHVLTHDPSRPRFRCSHCDDFFTRQADLRRHERSVHPCGSAPLYACPACGARMKRKDSLNKHMNVCGALHGPDPVSSPPVADAPAGEEPPQAHLSAVAPGADATTATATLPSPRL
ncbi:hypothetical protein HK405_014131 [Cladochytrium tenue]|nr:hypothetical protein HK405_014131 [Cladochytrium tenue]